MSGGGHSTTTTVQKNDPWAGAQPGLSNLYGNATSWYNNGGTQAVGSNSNIDAGLQQLVSRAQNGSPYMKQAQSLGQNWMSGQAMADDKTAQGYYLGNQNPYLAGMFKAASAPVTQEFTNSIMPSLASQFSSAGRMGSNSHMQAAQMQANSLGQTLGNLSSNIYGAAYGHERDLQQQAISMEKQNQLAAMGLAPQFAQSDYMDAEKLFNAGQYQRQMQQEINNQPLMNLQAYNGIMQSASPYATQTGTQTQQQPKANPFGSVLGGAMMGAMVPGIGPLVGAGVGLASGLWHG